jgi:hypothetical protein
MYDNVFKRVEQKYLINKEQYDLLICKIKPYLKKDKFFKSNINNIYFDNDNNDLIINSIEKPLFKLKIRLRSYSPNDIFIEIKNKYKSTVGKRRIKIESLEKFLNSSDEDQISKEIKYYIDYYKLKPKIYIGYDRLSYKAKDDDLRLTFDFNLRSRNDDLTLDKDYGEKYFLDDLIIMEVKTLSSLPMWFVKALSSCKIYPTSFSKYGKIYERNLGDLCVR